MFPMNDPINRQVLECCGLMQLFFSSAPGVFDAIAAFEIQSGVQSLHSKRFSQRTKHL